MLHASRLLRALNMEVVVIVMCFAAYAFGLISVTVMIIET